MIRCNKCGIAVLLDDGTCVNEYVGLGQGLVLCEVCADPVSSSPGPERNPEDRAAPTPMRPGGEIHAAAVRAANSYYGAHVGYADQKDLLARVVTEQYAEAGEALEFYAEKANHTLGRVIADAGDKARAALAKVRG